MGVNFNWFKAYEVVENKINMIFGEYIDYRVEYLDGDSTSYGYGNRTKLQNIFKRYLNVEIPTINDYLIDKDNLNLIEPSLMSIHCDKLLSNKNYELEDMRDRIEQIKELSDEGYYVSYDVS